ncbi:MAG: 2-C-methyl-D-erythritol 4-phosphate cytidylyltransferase [Lachnospiraceae bacterium]|nr:2-C-methyl-D-erythritol 4-phosphate cytidylyltransferase [Lachnospiraceae bacterium]
MSVEAIILASGTGKRMNSDKPKQYIDIQGKPLLYYTIKQFDNELIEGIVLVVGENDIEYCKSEIVEKYGLNKVKCIVAGGKERYNSVYNGLKYIDADYVMIHDGARPFISAVTIDKVYKELQNNDACIVGVKAKDTVKIADDEGMVSSTPDRSYVWQVQTPQAFKTEKIKIAYEKAFSQDMKGITDDAMVWEKCINEPVKLVEGEYTNIKITTPEDLIIANAYVDMYFKKQENNDK